MRQLVCALTVDPDWDSASDLKDLHTFLTGSERISWKDRAVNDLMIGRVPPEPFEVVLHPGEERAFLRELEAFVREHSREGLVAVESGWKESPAFEVSA